ncbi:hypothetical protein RQP46_001850 [Phenoliferia psychrophenolica]
MLSVEALSKQPDHLLPRILDMYTGDVWMPYMSGAFRHKETWWLSQDLSVMAQKAVTAGEKEKTHKKARGATAALEGRSTDGEGTTDGGGRSEREEDEEMLGDFEADEGGEGPGREAGRENSEAPELLPAAAPLPVRVVALPKGRSTVPSDASASEVLSKGLLDANLSRFHPRLKTLHERISSLPIVPVDPAIALPSSSEVNAVIRRLRGYSWTILRDGEGLSAVLAALWNASARAQAVARTVWLASTDAGGLSDKEKNFAILKVDGRPFDDLVFSAVLDHLVDAVPAVAEAGIMVAKKAAPKRAREAQAKDDGGARKSAARVEGVGSRAGGGSDSEQADGSADEEDASDDEVTRSCDAVVGSKSRPRMAPAPGTLVSKTVLAPADATLDLVASYFAGYKLPTVPALRLMCPRLGILMEDKEYQGRKQDATTRVVSTFVFCVSVSLN